MVAHIYDPASPVASGKVLMKGAVSMEDGSRLGFMRLRGLGSGRDVVVFLDDEAQALDLILSILSAVDYMASESAPDMIVGSEFNVE